MIIASIRHQLIFIIIRNFSYRLQEESDGSPIGFRCIMAERLNAHKIVGIASRIEPPGMACDIAMSGSLGVRRHFAMMLLNKMVDAWQEAPHHVIDAHILAYAAIFKHANQR